MKHLNTRTTKCQQYYCIFCAYFCFYSCCFVLDYALSSHMDCVNCMLLWKRWIHCNFNHFIIVTTTQTLLSNFWHYERIPWLIDNFILKNDCRSVLVNFLTKPFTFVVTFVKLPLFTFKDIKVYFAEFLKK